VAAMVFLSSIKGIKKFVISASIVSFPLNIVKRKMSLVGHSVVKPVERPRARGANLIFSLTPGSSQHIVPLFQYEFLKFLSRVVVVERKRRVNSKRMSFFIMGWFGMLFYFAQRWLFGPLIPSLMQTFSTDRTALGVVGSASLWGYMFMPVLAGSISDRFGRKQVILFGIFGFSVLTMISGLVNSTTQLFWSRFFTGTFEAFYFVPIAAYTLELFPENPAFFLGLLISGSAVGWFVGPAAAGWLLDLTGTWRTAFLVIGAGAFSVAVLQWWFFPKETQGTRTGAFFDKVILERKNLVMLFFLSLVLTFQMASEFGFTMWFPAYLRTEIFMSATNAGLLTGCFGIGMAIGRPTMGYIADRSGYRRIGVVGSATMGIFFILALLISNPFFRACSVFSAGFLGSAATGGLWTFTGLRFSSFKGLALGLIVTFAYCIASLGPITMGYIGDHYSIETALWTVSVPCAFLAGAAFFPTFALHRTRPQRQSGKSDK
jgi:MFS transporter, YNFM family, putative membrane transport protein